MLFFVMLLLIMIQPFWQSAPLPEQEVSPRLSIFKFQLHIIRIRSTMRMHFDRTYLTFLTFNFGYQLRIILPVGLKPNANLVFHPCIGRRMSSQVS